jgi:hypothetical protein
VNTAGVLAEVSAHPGTTTAPPAPAADIEALRPTLPAAHLELLGLTNGLAVAGGHLRLFGVGASASRSIEAWNDPDLWQFAWAGAVDDFLCVGENGWGGQLAYRRSDLATPDHARPLYLLADSSMAPGLVGESFRAWLDVGLRANLDLPAHPFEAAVRRQFPALAWDELLAQAPPMLVCGEERPELVTRMPAVVTMIVNGDLWTQLAGAPPGSNIAGMDTDVDERGRTRVRLRFA